MIQKRLPLSQIERPRARAARAADLLRAGLNVSDALAEAGLPPWADRSQIRALLPDLAAALDEARANRARRGGRTQRLLLDPVRRERFLEVLRRGGPRPVADACTAVGVSRTGYHRERARDRAFAEQCDALIGRATDHERTTDHD